MINNDAFLNKITTHESIIKHIMVDRLMFFLSIMIFHMYAIRISIDVKAIISAVTCLIALIIISEVIELRAIKKANLFGITVINILNYRTKQTEERKGCK